MGLKRRRQIEFGLTMVARVGGRAELKWWKLLYLYLYFFQYVFLDKGNLLGRYDGSVDNNDKDIEICIL